VSKKTAVASGHCRGGRSVSGEARG
jgi:hypothetical protein